MTTSNTPEPSSPSTFEFGVDYEVFDCGWQAEHKGGFTTAKERDDWIRFERMRRPESRLRAVVPVRRRVGAWGPDQ